VRDTGSLDRVADCHRWLTALHKARKSSKHGCSFPSGTQRYRRMPSPVSLRRPLERFRRTSSLEGIPDERLCAMLAFDLTNPVAERDEGGITWMQHSWKQQRWTGGRKFVKFGVA
jgi:hypothetical protein